MAAVPDVRAVLHGGDAHGACGAWWSQVCDQAEARAQSSFAQQEQNRFSRSNCGGLLRHTGQSAEAERIQQSESEPRMLWTSPEVELLEHGSSESQKIIIFFRRRWCSQGRCHTLTRTSGRLISMLLQVSVQLLAP